jgi:hypothetical protein
MFVSLLSSSLGIPVLGLCDCNPFGLSILVRWIGLQRQFVFVIVLMVLLVFSQLTYKLGSARMPLESLQYGKLKFSCLHNA